MLDAPGTRRVKGGSLNRAHAKGLAFSLLAGITLSCASCGDQAANSAGGPRAAAEALRMAPTPAGPNSATPDLHARGEDVTLSWIEKEDRRATLKFSTFEQGRWSEPRTVAEGTNWFVNWADFPSVVRQPDGTLAAHWLVMSGGGRYAYDVNISQSRDGGKTWTRPIVPHRDGTRTEHGFVSLFPWSNGRTGAVWLDGRKFKEPEAGQAAQGPAKGPAHDGHDAGNEMTLRFAALDAGGALGEEIELDGRVCECCQTSAASTGDGVVVAYRDRSPGEVRDISVVRFAKGRWSAPATLHADNWEIHGCPVNGPSVAVDGRRVAVAWFTGAQDVARVKVAFSGDAGATFGRPLEITSGRTIGRVDVVMLADGALVTWLDGNEVSTWIKAMRVRPDGSRDAPFVVSEATASRRSGFPRMARAGNTVFFAWTEISKPGEPTRVRTAMASIR